MSAKIGWTKGGTAVVESLKDDAIALRSTVPSPPGSRIDGTLADGGDAVRVKVHSSKKQADGTFVIEGRLLDMTREVRAKLANS